MIAAQTTTACVIFQALKQQLYYSRTSQICSETKVFSVCGTFGTEWILLIDFVWRTTVLALWWVYVSFQISCEKIIETEIAPPKSSHLRRQFFIIPVLFIYLFIFRDSFLLLS